MEFSRRWSRIVQFLLVVAAATACGREGSPSALPDRAAFCKLATQLSNDATGKLAPLGASASLDEIAQALDSFIAEHRDDYAMLDRLAPSAIRPALRRQREAQRAFITADTAADRERAYEAAVRNGQVITAYERRNCF